MNNISKSKFSVTLKVISVTFWIILFSLQCSPESAYNISYRDIKHKGAHLFGSLDSSNIKVLDSIDYNWITLVPWGFQDNFKSKIVTHHNGDSAVIKSGNEDLYKRISLLKSKGLKVLVKPHVWVDTIIDRKWRSDIYPLNETNWELWKASYRDFIFRYAIIAEETNADMFCIGTEFTRLAIEKPEFWRSLIKDIRQVFTGKLIYAANWNDEYQKINFWDQLDFIGIQAYFPLSKNNNPNKDELISSWLKYIPEIDSIHNKFQKKILFTEMGYKSTIDAAIKPWNWLDNTDDKHQIISLETQSLCYKSFFETIWNKDWFAGVHLWQIRTDYKPGMKKNSLDFSPQGKPAEKVIRSYFNESKNAQ